MSKAWMPLFVGDYLGDTGHLTQGQHGAYLLFLMHYWQRGPLPSDRDECYCIAHAMDEQSRCNADKVLKQFFVMADGFYRNGRIDAEREKAKTSYERRLSAANSRWKKETKGPTDESKASALHMQSYSNPSDSDSNDLEALVLEISKLHPKIADPWHLSREYAGVILDAIAIHGDQVLEGTKRFRASFERWPKEKLKFAPGVERFFRQSEYLFPSSNWDEIGTGVDGKWTPPQNAPPGYVPESVKRKKELAERKAQGL